MGAPNIQQVLRHQTHTRQTPDTHRLWRLVQGFQTGFPPSRGVQRRETQTLFLSCPVSPPHLHTPQGEALSPFLSALLPSHLRPGILKLWPMGRKTKLSSGCLPGRGRAGTVSSMSPLRTLQCLCTKLWPSPPPISPCTSGQPFGPREAWPPCPEDAGEKEEEKEEEDELTGARARLGGAGQEKLLNPKATAGLWKAVLMGPSWKVGKTVGIRGFLSQWEQGPGAFSLSLSEVPIPSLWEMDMIQDFLPRGYFFSTNPLAPDVTPLQLAGRGSSEGKGVGMMSEYPKMPLSMESLTGYPIGQGLEGQNPHRDPAVTPRRSLPHPSEAATCGHHHLHPSSLSPSVGSFSPTTPPGPPTYSRPIIEYKGPEASAHNGINHQQPGSLLP